MFQKYFDQMLNAMKFFGAMMETPKVDWFSAYTVVHEDEAIRVLKFRDGTTGEGVLIFPPQAGHSSIIADHSDNKSIVQTAIRNTDHSIFAVDFKSCTRERCNESINDLVKQAHTAKIIARERVHKGKLHIIGLCQGGWLAGILTFLYPGGIVSFTTAGSPIDLGVAREKSTVCKFVDQYPQAFYVGLVMAGGGRMRGDFMLMGWKASNPAQRYIGDALRLFNSRDDEEGFARVKRDRDWYECTQDIAGNWYLQVVDQMFRKNMLWKQEMAVHGRTIRLQSIKIRINSIAGGADDITPPEQALALGGNCTTIPDVGHIGIYVSRKSQPVWAKLFKTL